MRSVRSLAVMFGLGVVVGCVSSGPQAPAQPPAPRAAAESSAVVAAAPVTKPAGDCFMPLILDRSDLRMGTAVHFDRIPSAAEVHDLWTVPGLNQVVIALREWPLDYEPLQGLDRLPNGASLVILLRGYPPKPSAIDIWSYLAVPARVIVLLDGPPPGPAVVADLNAMRQLERVIVEMDYPSRSGLERLQRPVSFRKVVR